MPKAAVRANARTLPEATPHPDANVRALAAQFEAALQTYLTFFHGGGTDDEADAATNAVKAVAQKIVAVPGTDISFMRLKARVYLWAESTNLEKLAAEGGDWPSEAVLASLFRDLGFADLLDATHGLATMADGAPSDAQAAVIAAPVDPIFAAIAQHIVARDALIEAIPRADKVTAKLDGREVTKADEDAVEALNLDEEAAFLELFVIVPTTLEGMARDLDKAYEAGFRSVGEERS